MVDLLLLAGILAAGIRLGMAIGLSAIGESAAERSGVFNIGIEGIMLSAAFVAAWGSTPTPGKPFLASSRRWTTCGCPMSLGNSFRLRGPARMRSSRTQGPLPTLPGTY